MADIKTLQIGQTELTNEMPKICVPITGKTEKDIIQQLQAAILNQPDLIEWRIDYFAEVEDTNKLTQLGKKISQLTNDIPLLTTFRTADEGGELPLTDKAYFAICKEVIESGFSDAIDLELFHHESALLDLIDDAHDKNIVVIMSNHDFESTPTQDELVSRMFKMEQMDADVAKVAVMPNSAADVIVLLAATQEADQELSIPVISMSMGKLGQISRISGASFGSVLTFATVEQASAPGQMTVEEVRTILGLLNKN